MEGNRRGHKRKTGSKATREVYCFVLGFGFSLSRLLPVVLGLCLRLCFGFTHLYVFLVVLDIKAFFPRIFCSLRLTPHPSLFRRYTEGQK